MVTRVKEFKAGGEAHIIRPKQPTELSDDEWAKYLFIEKILKVYNLRDGTILRMKNGLM